MAFGWAGSSGVPLRYDGMCPGMAEATACWSRDSGMRLHPGGAGEQLTRVLQEDSMAGAALPRQFRKRGR